MRLINIFEGSPDTPQGSRSKDLNIGKLWLLTELKRLGNDKFDTVYVLGSWYGSMAPYLLYKHISFERAFFVDIDPKNTDYVKNMVHKIGLTDKIVPVTQDGNTTDYQGDNILVINTSTNDMDNQGWFDNIPQGSTVALEGRDQQWDNKENVHQELTSFANAYPVSEQYVVQERELVDMQEKPYNRFLMIGTK
jgi:hypothetical protein